MSVENCVPQKHWFSDNLYKTANYISSYTQAHRSAMRVIGSVRVVTHTYAHLHCSGRRCGPINAQPATGDWGLIMVVAFPLGKLIYLGIKQVSKPISRRIQAGAVRSPLFRKYVCMPPAQCKWMM